MKPQRWRVCHDGIGERPYIVDQHGKYVLEGWPGNREDMALAAAAPELYEAVTGLLALCGQDQDEVGPGIHERVVERAEAALRKARGEA